MVSDPEMVHYVDDHIVAFYEKALRIFLEATKGKVHAILIGDDVGSQRGLMISPKLISEFVIPGAKKLIAIAHSYGVKVVFHSCGSIVDAIPLLIDAGVDVIHPIQALAAGMENLAINSEITAGRKLVNRKRWEATAKEALSKIGYNIDLNDKMGDLSVADKQLVAICRALLFNAKLIIMIHADTRALSYSNELRSRFGRDYFYAVTGNVLSPTATLCKTIWLKNEEPEVYAKTRRILQTKDYLVYRLTGRMETTDLSDASHGMFRSWRTSCSEPRLLLRRSQMVTAKMMQ